MQPINEIAQEIPQESLLEASKPEGLEFDLLDLVLALVSRKRLILLTTLLCVVLVYIAVSLRTPYFTATALILPPHEEQSGAAALMGELASMAGMGGGGGRGGGGGSNELYIGILKSQTIADGLVKRFDLLHAYKVREVGAARAKLAKSSKFTSEKDGMITIAVSDPNAKLAAALANGYVDQLHDMNTYFAFTEATQRRIFYERQLAEEKDKLADAEVAMQATEEKTGILLPTGQVETVIRQIAQVQAEITSHEVELDELRTSSTDQNPDVIRLETELASLHQQEHVLEAGQKQAQHTAGDISISSAAAPEVSLEYVRKERDVKYHQMLFDFLARQYEGARIEEAKQAPVIQVVDPAEVPHGKAGPRAMLWAILAGFLAFCMSCAYVLASFIYRRMETDERTGSRMSLLKQELRLNH
jgi:tyrosine-protein kinase Etk/Wzc